MKVTIILNSCSTKKRRFYRRVLPALAGQHNVAVLETAYAGHAEVLAKQAGADVLLAAGGDGTLNQVLNGIMQRPEAARPVLGVVPLGTGNDFATACRLKADGALMEALLQKQSFCPTDVGKLICRDAEGREQTRYFLNVCSAGISPEVIAKMPTTTKKVGPTLAYLLSIAHVFFRNKPKKLTVNNDGTTRWNRQARIVAIANGQTFAKSLCIGPDNVLNDGRLSLFIAGHISTWGFLRILFRLKRRQKAQHPDVVYDKGVRYSMTGEPQQVEAEGEIQGHLPATIEVLPKVLSFLRPA